jgi:hypothetical protein
MTTKGSGKRRQLVEPMPLSKINPWDMLQAMMEQSELLDLLQQRPNERDTLPET